MEVSRYSFARRPEGSDPRRSFSNRAVPENFATSYPAARTGWFNIGVLHTSCNGRPVTILMLPVHWRIW